MKRTGTAYGILLTLLVMVILPTSSPLQAKVDITNVKATVTTEQDSSDPDKKKVLVTVTYDLEGTEEGKGAVMSLDARLRSPGKSRNIRPLDSELEGDFGGVVGDGSKQIVWEASATLERLNAEGKYDCTIDISAEGQGNAPARATLNINGYDPGVSHSYFGTGAVVMDDLNEIETSAICPQADRWETTADADAEFYQGEVSGFPTYRGRFPSDQFKGAVGGEHCSGFLAAKDLGTAQEKVWINFTGQFSKTADVNGTPVTANYVFQIRYHRIRTGKTLQEFIKIGNAGKPGQEGSFAESPAITKYDVHIDIGKEDLESSEEFELEVLKKVYKWHEGGALVMEVRAKGEGHFVEENGIYSLTDGNEVVINEKLKLEGSLLTIDTTYVHGTVAHPVLTFSGFITAGDLPAASNLSLSPWVLGKDLTLYPGSDWRASAGSMVLSAFGGAQFFPTKFTFEGGVKATAVRMDGRFEIHAASFGCTSAYNENPSTLDTYKSLFGAPVGIDVEGVEIIDNDLYFSKIKISKFGVKAVPGICLDEFTYVHDRVKDSLGVFAKITLPLPVDKKLKSIGGGFSMYRGKLNGISIEAETDIPIHPPPLTLKGLKASFDNYVTGPVRIKGEATFSHVSLETLAGEGISYIGPFAKLASAFPTIFEVTGGVDIIWPTTWALKGGIKVFGSAALGGIWLAEGEVTAGTEPVRGLLFVKDGTLKFLSIAGTKPLMDGTFSGSICLDFGSPAMNLQAKGALYVPNIVNGIPVLDKFGTMLGLPLELASVELQVRNTEASIKVPSRGKNATRTILIDLTKLPSASAFSCPECEGLSLFATEREKGHSPLAADTTWHTATVTSDLGELVFQLSGSPTLSQSVLVNPSGEVIAETRSDSSIVLTTVDGPEPVVLWTIVDPTPGNWKIGVIDQQETDVVDAFGIGRSRAPFDFDVDINGRNVTVTWQGTGAPDSSEVDFFLDQDEEGYNGLFIGTVRESDGEFSYTLSDSLIECSYFLHALRYDRGDYSKKYHTLPIENPKSSWQAPTDIAMTVDNQNNVTLTWTPSIDTNVSGYLVRLNYPDGSDSTIGMVPAYYNSWQFQTGGMEGVTLSIRSTATSGNSGCWSEPVGVPISGLHEERVITGEKADLGVRVMPNPADHHIDIRLDLPESGPLTATLYDVNGRPVRTLLAGEFRRGGATARVSLDEIASGSYVLFVVVGDRIAVENVVIRR